MKSKDKILYGIIVFCIIGCAAIAIWIKTSPSTPGTSHIPSSTTNDSTNVTDQASNPWPEEHSSDNSVIGLGEDIEVNGYTIKFGPEYYLSKVVNEFSDEYGQTAVKLLFTETNNSTKSGNFNHYSLSVYGPSGHSIKTSLGALFDDSSIKAGKILPGVTQKSYFYFLYAGSGEYTIEIDDWEEPDSAVTIKFNI